MSEEGKKVSVSGTGLGGFWEELRQRKVVRVAIAYLVVGLAIMEGGDIVLGNLGAPQWMVTALILVVIAGFPIALVASWVYELTPEGIRSTGTGSDEGDSLTATSSTKTYSPFGLFVAAAVPTLIFGLLAVYFYVSRSGDSGEVNEGEKSIAVLPLENMSPDPGHAYFADAIQDEILTNLANISDLVVIGRTSVRQYQDTVKTLQQIGKELGVRYLVEGSVFRDQNQASINIQLIDTETRDHMWAQVYDRNLDDIFSIRSAVAMDIAEQLHAVLSPNEVALVEAFPTQNRRAYDLYLKSSSVSYLEKIPLLSEATRLDPEFYLAWDQLASLIWAWNNRGPEVRYNPDVYAVARNALDEMVRIAPDSLLTLKRQAMFAINYDYDLEEALRIRLKLESLWGYERDVPYTYLQLGRLEDTRDAIEKSFIRDPVNTKGKIDLYNAYELLGEWDKAREVMDAVWEKYEITDPINEDYHLALRIQQQDFLITGDVNSLVKSFEVVPEFINHPFGKLWKTLILRDLSAAETLIDEIRSADPPIRPMGSLFNYHCRLIYQGQLDRGLDIEPMNLVSALIHFHKGERKQWMEESIKAKQYWEDRIRQHHKFNPDYLANLAICHALEGDRETMEKTIPRIRELTKTVNWQFRAQAECEAKIAIAYVILGENEKAIDLLEQANALNSPFFINREAKLWFMFDSLKGNPRFEALLAD